MITNKRVAKKVNIEKSKHRKKRNNKVNGGKKDRTQRTVTFPPERCQCDDSRKRRNVSDRLRRVDLPLWIDEDERMRPQQFSEIEPNVAPGDDHAIQRC